MTELSLHILDVAYNSIAAAAGLIKISLDCNTAADKLTVTIEDNGRGMSEDFLRRVTNPFTTTRTTRKVGMGVPLFKMAAETAGGSFKIDSRENEGTTVVAEFGLSHIDRQPLGDMPLTLTTLLGGAGKAEIVFEARCDDREYVMDTREIRAALGDDDLNDVSILAYLKEMIRENLEIIFGGITI